MSLNLRVVSGEAEPAEVWQSLPDLARAQLLSLFARLMARGVVAEDEEDITRASAWQRWAQRNRATDAAAQPQPAPTRRAKSSARGGTTEPRGGLSFGPDRVTGTGKPKTQHAKHHK